jgi:hypothetical protein
MLMAWLGNPAEKSDNIACQQSNTCMNFYACDLHANCTGLELSS